MLFPVSTKSATQLLQLWLNTATRYTAMKIKHTLVKARSAIVKSAKNTRGVIRNFIYKETRNSDLYTSNLRKPDFKAPQQIVSGALPKSAASVAVLTSGVEGVAISAVKARMPQIDLGDGRIFDVSSIKSIKALSLGSALVNYGKSAGKAHTIKVEVGPMKGTHTGYIVGDLKLMNVAFISKDGRHVWTLNTRALPKGRNKDRVFSLVH